LEWAIEDVTKSMKICGEGGMAKAEDEIELEGCDRMMMNGPLRRLKRKISLMMMKWRLV
jgi:hypothetical protein